MSSVLDLPEERQRQIAAEMEFSDFEKWREHIATSLKAGREYAEKMDKLPDLLDSMTLEEREHARKKFSQPIVLMPDSGPQLDSKPLKKQDHTTT